MYISVFWFFLTTSKERAGVSMLLHSTSNHLHTAANYTWCSAAHTLAPAQSLSRSQWYRSSHQPRCQKTFCYFFFFLWATKHMVTISQKWSKQWSQNWREQFYFEHKDRNIQDVCSVVLFRDRGTYKVSSSDKILRSHLEEGKLQRAAVCDRK